MSPGKIQVFNEIESVVYIGLAAAMWFGRVKVR